MSPQTSHPVSDSGGQSLRQRFAADDPAPQQVPVGLRRHGDRCFHPIEDDAPPHGYIVDGILISHDDIAELVFADPAAAADNSVRPCPRADPRHRVIRDGDSPGLEAPDSVDR